METNQQYVICSLELHLFFARIMKEHSLFLMAGFPSANAACVKEAERYKCAFEGLLRRAVALSDGVVGQKALSAGEFFTPFTACAEQQTQHLTGICIDQKLTALETRLRAGDCTVRNPELYRQVKRLNQAALRQLDGLIALKERILDHVLHCHMFTMNYPLLLEHIIREAKLYREYVCRLETQGCLDSQDMRQVEQFWNQIMMEHAQFIRGLLDPSENELMETADSFAKDYAKLLESCCAAQDKTLTAKALAQTQKFRDFKAAGTQGIQECKIRSIILPLLADHVLREANHYLRLLECGK